MLLHVAYHKGGTVWWLRTLQQWADRTGRRFLWVDAQRSCRDRVFSRPDAHACLLDLAGWSGGGRHPEKADVCMASSIRGPFDPAPFRITHMIRDPRDMMVSSYFYHVWCEERWVKEPREQFGGKSWQEYLRSVSVEVGLLASIDFAMQNTCEALRESLAWQGHPNVLTLRYEDVLHRPEEFFRRAFEHYRVDGDDIDAGIACAMANSFERVSGGRMIGVEQRNDHCRKGVPGEWKEYFDATVTDQFQRRHGDILAALGYESTQQQDPAVAGTFVVG
jgi:Sulfotransferase domain